MGIDGKNIDCTNKTDNKCRYDTIQYNLQNRQSEYLKKEVSKIVNTLKTQYGLENIEVRIINGSLILTRKDFPNNEVFLLSSDNNGYCKIGGLGNQEYKIEDAIRIGNFFNLLRGISDFEYKNGIIIKDNPINDTDILTEPKWLSYFSGLGIDFSKLKKYCSDLNDFQKNENKTKSELNRLSFEIMMNKVTKIEVQNEYYVELKYRKRNFSLDPMTHLKNAATATTKKIRISREQYERYKKQIGTEVNSTFDGVKFLTEGKLAMYIVTINGVEEKQAGILAYDNSGNKISINNLQSALSVLNSKSKKVSKKTDGDTDLYYVGGFENIERKRKRYSLRLEIQNSNFSLDIFKHLRNSLNTHEINVEVPKSVYDTFNKGEIYDETNTNIASFILKGRVGNIKVKVLDKNEIN